MPVISRIGARSFKVRFVYRVIFFILVLGSVTMIYPLLLMLAGSVKSDTLWYPPTPIFHATPGERARPLPSTAV